MELRNRIGLYGSCFVGVAGIGFMLPCLLSGVGVLASAVVIFAVPETLVSEQPLLAGASLADERPAGDLVGPAE